MSEWRILRGNCLNHLPGIKADALITDPPYGQNYQPSRTGTAVRVSRGLQMVNRDWPQIVGEDQPFDPTPFLGFDVVCLWGANHFADKLPARAGWFIWDKRDGIPSNDQSDCEMAWTNRNRAARMYRQMWNGIIRAGRENIAKSGDKLHPHQKPIALMMWCIEQLGLQPGQTIYDPYAGSATTGAAALEMGLNFIGSEIDPHYADVAEERLSAIATQPSIWAIRHEATP